MTAAALTGAAGVTLLRVVRAALWLRRATAAFDARAELEVAEDPREVLARWVAEAPGAARRAAPLLQAPRAAVAQLAAAVVRAGRRAEPTPARPRDAVATEATPFGGLFMLLPLLENEDLDAGWPDCGDDSAVTVARALVLAKAAGPRAAEVLDDPIWREVLGLTARRDAIVAWSATVEPGADAEVDGLELRERPRRGLPSWLEQVSAGWLAPALDRALGAATLRVLGAFARRLPGFAESSPRYLFASFLDVPATLERRGDERFVRLGRPPIHAVLSMTGLAKARFAPRWSRGVRYALYPE